MFFKLWLNASLHIGASSHSAVDIVSRCFTEKKNKTSWTPMYATDVINKKTVEVTISVREYYADNFPEFSGSLILFSHENPIIRRYLSY